MGSNHQFQNQMPEEFVHLLSSTISCQENYLSQNGGSSMWGSSFNVPNPVVQMPHQNGPPVSGNLDIRQQSYTTNAGPNAEESSFNTDANSSLARVSYFPSNGNGSTESLVSGTPTGNSFSAQHHIIQAGQACSQWFGGQEDELSNDLSPQLMIPAHQAPVRPLMNKRPRSEIQPDDALLGYTLQQLSPNQVPVQLHQQILPDQIPMQLDQQPSPIQVPMQLQTYDPVVASRIFQQQLIQKQQQNQIILSVHSPQGHLQQRLPPQQMPEDVQKTLTAFVAMKGNICACRLMQYIYSQRQRPPDNNIDYWRKFVHAYYSLTAKRRWWFSKNRYRGYQDYGIDSWKCDLCESDSGKGFDVCYEALRRMKHIYFNSGVVDELLYLDSPAERRLPSGFMVLSYGRAVQESVYKHSRVIHEGQLRIAFTEELKIISWEFCVQFHKELVSRRLVAAQVTHSGEGSSSQGPEHTDLAGSSSSSSPGSTWADIARQCQGSTISSSVRQPSLTIVPGIRLPTPPFPHVEYLCTIGLARTFWVKYGMNKACSEQLSINNYYLHYLLAARESKNPIQAPFDSSIPAVGSYLDTEMKTRWASFTQLDVLSWRRDRWGTTESGHGIRQPLYDQESYFYNGCKIHEFLNVKGTMKDTACSLRCPLIRHADYNWREVKISCLFEEWTRRWGCTPKLYCEDVDGRLCLSELKFRLGPTLELLSYGVQKDCLEDGLLVDQYILF